MELEQIKHGQKIINELLNSSHYLTVEELQEKLHISRRSVFYAFKKINIFLDEQNVEPINNVKNLGYFLTDNSKSELLINQDSNKTQKSYSKNERQTILIWNLINKDKVSISKAMKKFNISNHTAINDFAIVDDVLKKRELYVEQSSKGKILSGSKISARTWVLEQLNDPHSIIHNLIGTDQAELNFIQKKLHDLEKLSGNYFSDNAILILSEFIYWLVNFISNKKYVLKSIPDNYKDLQSVSTNWSSNFLKHYQICNNYETQFLAQILYTSQFSSINTSDTLNKEMHVVTQQVIEKFNIASGSNLSSYSLEVSLSTHLLSTLYRSSLGIKYKHPDLESFIDKYHDLFIFSKYAVKPFEDYIGKTLNDDEISLIAVYFGGQLRDIHRRKDWNTDVLLVCPSGIGTSVLLKNQLTTRYPDITFSEPLSVFQFNNCPLDDIKLIISTIELNVKENIPTLRVSPLLTKEDLRKVDSVLSENRDNEIIPKVNTNTLLDIIGDYARIEDVDGLTNAINNYLDAYNSKYMHSNNLSNNKTELGRVISLNNITCLNKVVPWENAIAESFTQLKRSGSVTQKYIDRIIELTMTKGPYMLLGNGVFLAHAAPQDGVRRLGISVLVSHKPIKVSPQNFEPCEIKLIIALAPVDQKKHLKVLSELFQKIQDKKWLKNIEAASDEEDIFNMLVSPI
ncbi:PTS sugar transporter subunit IIA [Paucilactobacillus suebicus]|uniref:PTS system EIIA component n=1 Tax=Paucilactobacillus suebicus DSM 5007 = KCTC 3549 TaxID=1423807 RepID=A0A0R1WEV1_9LACO|nr:PTS sugar transporter subunit IIA [Paucilactobacillus suebicus]KRM12604.1 hypothetical protein FD16_GL002117 [Paucilactobacillus suebicus DSM 5007 = KCTC 3549]